MVDSGPDHRHARVDGRRISCFEQGHGPQLNILHVSRIDYTSYTHVKA